MTQPSQRRTTGIMTYIVGAAIAQAIIHELAHISNMRLSQPSTRQVATPVTRKVMKKLVPRGRANLNQRAGSFFTAAGTIWYGLGRRPSLRKPSPMSLALPFQTAKQLAAAVRKKKIGCVELLNLYLKRVEAYNPELNAIIATDIEGARKRAKASDKAVKAGKKLGPLHGVPMTIKESYDVAGFPTTWGHPAFKDTIVKTNSLVTQR